MTTIKIIKPHKYLYLVDRTSSLCTEAPCEEAFLVTIVKIELQWEANKENWDKIGTNHRIDDGVCVRDNGLTQAWAVRIASLQALQDFVAKYGKCVIDRYNVFNKIEIYDVYRE